MLHNTLSTTGSSTFNSEKDRYLLILDEAMRIFLNKENADIEKVIEFLDSTVEIIPHIEVSYFMKKTSHNLFKSPPTMWWWRLIVFAESARRRRHLFLLSLENP